MSEQETIISNILKAQKIEDVLTVANLGTEFKHIIKQIHPDVCSLPGAAEASKRISDWRDLYDHGKKYRDDVCTMTTNGYWADFAELDADHKQNLAWSLENYQKFMELKGSSDEHFKKYLPQHGRLMPDGRTRFEFEKRAIPISGLALPQEHVNWVLNRLLEYCAYLSQAGFSHCGLNPESVFIVPETHGIQICSFYHLTRIGNRIGTISGKYSHWYPPEIFANKTATPLIDIECSKKIAAYLLGDVSGTGIKLRKTHNEDFVNFIVQHHTNAYEAMTAYRELLAKNFKKEFHTLSI